MENTRDTGMPRREFLATAAVATAGLTFVRSSAVAGTKANSKIEVGLLGCGGRGTWITELFNQHGGYQFVAVADYYQEHVDKVGSKLGVDPSRRYTTLSAYKKM